MISGEAVPWNSCMTDPRRSEGVGTERVCPSTGCRTAGNSLALITRMHNWLPPLFRELQSPIPMAALSRPAPKHPQGDGKGSQHTELGLRNSSRLTGPALKCAEKHFGFAL